MAEVPLFVLDASTALKWRFPEGFADREADTVLRDYMDGSINLVGPHQLAYEYAFVTRRRVIEGKLTRPQARSTYEWFLGLNIPLLDTPTTLLEGLDTMLQANSVYTIQQYDTLYVALARTARCQLITADRPMAQNLRASPYAPHLLWIEDYPQYRPQVGA